MYKLKNSLKHKNMFIKFYFIKIYSFNQKLCSVQAITVGLCGLSITCMQYITVSWGVHLVQECCK